MTTEEIKDELKEFLVAELEISPERISDDARLKEDIGIDSLDYVEIIAFVRRSYGFKIEKAEMSGITTYGQFCQFISSKTVND